MEWDRQRKKQFRQVLCQVYPDPDDLEMFVEEDFGERLAEITTESTLRQITFQLIRWAESKGCLDELFATFCKANSDNPIVNQFKSELQGTVSGIDGNSENLEENKKSILIVAANPKDTKPLRLQEEKREIQEKLRLAGYGKVPIYSTEATRSRDLQQAILEFQPQIVHFSGHGANKEGLLFEDGNGETKLISSEALGNLFRLFSDCVECVVLNACYSQHQAEIIAQHIDYVVGMKQEIGDRAAIEFSVGFYTGIGSGKSIDFSYELGCNAIQLEGIPNHLVPGLWKKSDVLKQGEQENIPNFFAYDRYWVGRQSVISDITNRIWSNCRLLIVVGVTGIGKTALGERISIELNDWLGNNWNRFYQKPFDSEDENHDFISFATKFLERQEEFLRPEERKDPKQILKRFKTLLQNNRYLIQIDSLENVLQGDEDNGWSDFQDEWWVKFFENYLKMDYCRSCIILTSQDLPRQIQEVGTRYQNFWYCQAISGLEDWERLELFQKIGINLSSLSGSQSYLERIGNAYEGHPLALRVIAGEIRRSFQGNVFAYWKKYGKEIEEIEKSLQEAQIGNTTGIDDKWRIDRFTQNLKAHVQSRLHQTFNRLKTDAWYAYLLICQVSIYRCPVPEEFWLSHLEEWVDDEEQQKIALDVLRDRYLIEELIDNENRSLLRMHNLVRSTALRHLEELDESYEWS
jgi:hypothetical protein